MVYWTTNNIPDLSGKIAIVTGANSGIGFYTAYWLAVRGARVVLACRNMEKAHETVDQMLTRNPNLALDTIRLDLANLDSIRGFAAVFRQRYTCLDMLINNAGIMAIPYQKTDDGFEMQFGTNHLGHFALTGLLLECLLKIPEARVVTVSSMMHNRGRIDFENLNAEQSYQKWRAYRQSKLANVLFTFELQNKFTEYGVKALSIATNPGYANTNLSLVPHRMAGNKTWIGIMRIANKILAQRAEIGALTSLFASTSPDARGGDFIQPHLFGIWGYPKPAKTSRKSNNKADAIRLWKISEWMTNIDYSF